MSLTYTSNEYDCTNNMWLKQARVWPDFSDIVVVAIVIGFFTFVVGLLGFVTIDAWWYSGKLIASPELIAWYVGTIIGSTLFWPVHVFSCYLILRFKIKKENKEKVNEAKADIYRRERDKLTREIDMFVKEVRK